MGWVCFLASGAKLFWSRRETPKAQRLPRPGRGAETEGDGVPLVGVFLLKLSDVNITLSA